MAAQARERQGASHARATRRGATPAPGQPSMTPREDLLDVAACPAAGRALAAGLVGAEGEDVMHQLGDAWCSSSNATTPPWPTLAPMARSSSKPSGVSSSRGGMHAGDRPADDQALQRSPMRRPPPSSSTTRRTGMPNSTSYRPGSAEERVERQRPWCPARSRTPARVGIAAVRDDPRDVDQRLDVVDQRRPAEEARLRGIRRPGAHFGPPSFDRVEQRRLLAADVAALAPTSSARRRTKSPAR